MSPPQMHTLIITSVKTSARAVYKESVIYCIATHAAAHQTVRSSLHVIAEGLRGLSGCSPCAWEGCIVALIVLPLSVSSGGE